MLILTNTFFLSKTRCTDVQAASLLNNEKSEKYLM